MSDDDLIRRGDVLKAVQYHVTDDDDRNTLSHAIAAMPAVKVGVKPLVWKREADNAWVAAHYAIQQYWPHNNGPFAVSGWYLSGLGVISLGKHPTLEAAKAAAQADYEARILAALEPAPTDAAQAREAKSWDEFSDEQIHAAMNAIQRETETSRKAAILEAANVCKVFQSNARTNDAWLHACEIEEAILALIGEAHDG